MSIQHELVELKPKGTYFFNDTETKEVKNLPFQLVCEECSIKVSQSVWLKLQNFTFLHFWRQDPRIKVSAELFPSEGRLCSMSCSLTCRQLSLLCFFTSSSFSLQQDPHFLFL